VVVVVALCLVLALLGWNTVSLAAYLLGGRRTVDERMRRYAQR